MTDCRAYTGSGQPATKSGRGSEAQKCLSNGGFRVWNGVAEWFENWEEFQVKMYLDVFGRDVEMGGHI